VLLSCSAILPYELSTCPWLIQGSTRGYPHFELDKRVALGHFDVFHGGYRGIGGKCLPKDVDALIAKSEALTLNPELLETLRRINKRLSGI